MLSQDAPRTSAPATDDAEAKFRNDLAADGFALLPGRLDDDVLDRLTREVRGNFGPSNRDYILGGRKFYGEALKRAYELPAKSPALLEILGMPLVDLAIEATLADYCDHALLSSATAIEVSKVEGVKPQMLHRDDDIYPALLPRAPDGPEYTMNVMVACTDFTEANGATRLARGSHKWRRPPTRDDEIVCLEMPRGGCGVWLGSVLHGAGVNQTDEPRLGVVLTFNLGWMRTLENYFLSMDRETVRRLKPSVQRLLGYDLHGTLGMYDWQSPMKSYLGNPQTESIEDVPGDARR